MFPATEKFFEVAARVTWPPKFLGVKC